MSEMKVFEENKRMNSDSDIMTTPYPLLLKEGELRKIRITISTRSFLCPIPGSSSYSCFPGNRNDFIKIEKYNSALLNPVPLP